MQQVAVEASVVATTSLFVAIVNKLKNSFYSFGDKEMKEMRLIQEAYRRCLSIEKEHVLTTLRVGEMSQRAESKAESLQAPDNLPIYFQMREDKKKIPVLWLRKFCPEKRLGEWLHFVDPASALIHPIEEVLGYICTYQNSRDQRMPGARGYNYDPTNLFFEEFKAWLVELSKSTLNESVLTIVEGRIRYLQLLKRVFKPGNDLPTRAQIMLHIKGILEKSIVPMIKLIIARQSAREHTAQLKSQVDRIIKQGVKFLLYVFRDTRSTPRSFIFKEIRIPTVPEYLKLIQTVSGRLLHHLCRSPRLVDIFPEVVQELPTIPSQNSIAPNDFLDSSNKQHVRFPWVGDETTTYNWFLVNEMDIGILPIFRTHEVMQEFLRLHGIIQDLCLFSAICLQLFELSGDGGNLLVYGLALSKIQLALWQYEKTLDNFDKTISFLHKMANEYDESLVRKQKKEQMGDNTKIWTELFDLSGEAHEAIKKAMFDSRRILFEMHAKIKEVNSPDYIQQVQERLNYFSTLVQQFVEKDTLASRASPDTSLRLSPYVSVFLSNENAQKQISSPKDREMRVAESLFADKQYQEASEAFFPYMQDKSNLVRASKAANYCARSFWALKDDQNTESALSIGVEIERAEKNKSVWWENSLFLRSVYYQRRNRLPEAEKDLHALLNYNPKNQEAEQLLDSLTVENRRVLRP